MTSIGLGLFQPLKSPESLSASAFIILEELIVTLKLAPGQQIKEQELSEQLNCGRTPLREALQRLAEQRLIKVIPRKGMMVADLNISDLFLISETRLVLDELLLKSAVKRAGKSDLEQLSVIANAMILSARNKDVLGFLRADFLFDQIIAGSAKNPFAAEAAFPLHSHSRRFWYFLHPLETLMISAEKHNRICELLVERNEAELLKANSDLIQYFSQMAKEAMIP